LSQALQLGPLLLPFTLLLVFASAGAALAVGRWLSRGVSHEVETTLWLAMLVGVVAARVAFVFEYRMLYLASPPSVIDVRDGGWNAPFGFIAAWAFAWHRERRAPAIRRPLRWALALGTVLFAGGSVMLALQPGPGRQLPELTFTSLEGKPVPLTGFAGRPTVVNLWATWCPPCVREMPVLHDAQRRHPGVHFVFLNQGEEPAEVQHWLGQRGLGTLRNVLVDERRQASASFKSYGYPTTLFFDAQGRLVGRRTGELSAATLDEQLQRALR
jgi:thiol-disulfide isomerase/thioredoxin